MVLRRSQAAPHPELVEGGAELLAGQGGAGEFVHQPIVGVLDGAGLAAVPADQVEAAAAFGIGAVGDDAEMAHRVAVAQQSAVARADADRQIARGDTASFFQIPSLGK